VDLLLSLENTALGDAVRSSAPLYATLQIGHLIAMATLVGTGFVLDLRLIGVARMPVAELLRVTDLPLALAAAVAVVTGLVMFSAEATTMAANPAFQAKVVLIGLLFGNALGFRWGARRSLPSWADVHPPPVAARVAGGLAIAGWVATVAAARLIAFV
jgi:hypothetical protein